MMNHQQIQAARQMNAERRFNAHLAGNLTSIGNAAAQQMRDQHKEGEAAFELLLRNGFASLTASQKKHLTNAMSTTTGSEGGYTVPTTVSVAIADALNQYSSVRRMATVILTSTGENMKHPSTDGRSEVGEQLAQNAASALQDISFSNTNLNTFKYGSKLITVPRELLQDSSIDMVGLVTRRIATRLGRITNTKFTTGAGTTEPMGVATAAAVGKTGATGQTLTVIHDDLEDLVGSVDASYRESPKCGWMMNDATLRTIAKLKDTAGQPLNLVKHGSRALGTPTTLLGFPVETNPDMPVMAADAKSILFGDFSGYVIRDAVGITFHRFEDSHFALNNQVGFLGIARAGGALVDIGTGIMAYKNSAT